MLSESSDDKAHDSKKVVRFVFLIAALLFLLAVLDSRLQRVSEQLDCLIAFRIQAGSGWDSLEQSEPIPRYCRP